MRNLPDDELMDKLKSQLQQFEEQPDDDTWDGIAPGISTAEPRWIRSAERSSLVAILLLFAVQWGLQSLQPRKTVPHISQTINAESNRTSTSEINKKATVGKDPVTIRDGKKTTDVDQESVTEAGKTSPMDIARRSSSEFNRPSPSVADRETSINQQDVEQTKGGRKSRSSKETEHRQQDARIIAASKTGEAGDYTTELSGINTTEPKVNADELTAASSRDSVQVTIVEGTDEGQTFSSTTKQKAVKNASLNSIAEKDSASTLTVLPGRHSKRKESAISFYATTTPALTFVDVTPSTTDQLTFQALNSPGVLSKERLSLSFEAGAQLVVAKRFTAFAGLTWFQQSMDLSFEQLAGASGSFSSNGSLDFSFQPEAATTTIQYRLQNVGVTAGLYYAVSLGKITHHLGGSLQYEYGILHPSSDRESQSANFFNYRVFYRADYGLSERLSIFIQPSFIRSLSNHDMMDGALRVKQSRAGIGIGMVFKLGIRN